MHSILKGQGNRNRFEAVIWKSSILVDVIDNSLNVTFEFVGCVAWAQLERHCLSWEEQVSTLFGISYKVMDIKDFGAWGGCVKVCWVFHYLFIQRRET